MKLKNRVAVITGGCSGMGHAIANLFAEEGAKVVIVSRARTRKCEEAIDTIKESLFIQADISNSAEVRQMVKEVTKKYGKIDILVNNAGVNLLKTVLDTTEEEWDKIIDVNLKGVFLCSKYVIPEMIKNGGGVIINMASMGGLVGAKLSSAYCASKGGVVLLTKAMALDFAPYNIRINCICPGAVDTPMFEQQLEKLSQILQVKAEDLRRAWSKVHPIGRLGRPEDIAYAALYLASEESSFITGSSLVINGGRTATAKEIPGEYLHGSYKEKKNVNL